MKKILYFLLLCCITTTLYGQYSASQIQSAKAMIANNPALLNSPEAQRMLQQNQTLTENKAMQDRSIPDIVNEISHDENRSKIDIDPETQNLQSINEKIDTNLSMRLSPFQYKDNNEALLRIKSIHTTNKRQKLERFSKEFFRNKNKKLQKNINAPANYIINRGDTITFWVYGATNKEHILQVNNQGNINIPEVGPVKVAGEQYAEVKELLTNYLSSSYKNSEVVVDLNAYSTAQVTLTGFVNAPGIFNTSSISSVKDILIEANGVSNVGSVRHIYVKRAGRTIAKIDYYHLLSLGLQDGDVVLQPNDTIHVPRAQGLVKLEGAVNKEAIFEIERGESLARILRVAGGVKSEADGLQIQIKRYDNNRQIKYHKISLAQASTFSLKDGDEIYVGAMRASHENFIEIVGNVISEGKREIGGDTIQLSTLLNKEIVNSKLNTFFLENTQLDYAVVKRIGKDLTPQMINLNLANILDGMEDFTLFNQDILYIYNKLDTKINPYVTIQQVLTEEEVKELNMTQSLLMQDGRHLFTAGMTLQDLINAAGIKNAFDKERVKIVSHDKEHKKTNVRIINYNQNPNVLLQAFDTVYLFDFFETNPIDTAFIAGEVIKPGKYEITPGMSLDKFIQSAGGLSEKAYPKECEIIRYHIENGQREKKIFKISMQDVNKFILQKHDEINIKRVPNWYERKTVTLKGEVKFPGTYVIHSGEKLSSVIDRAGGYTKEAFLYGAVFTREEIANLQKESLKMALSKLKEQVILASLRAAGSKSMNAINITESINAVESLIVEAENLTPIGRVSINLGYDGDASCDEYGSIGSAHISGTLKGTASDLTLKDKDMLYIPSFNDTVVVSGEVMNPMASTYLGDNIREYIKKSGGLTEVADTEHIYVMHANGEAEKATLGSYLFSSNKVNVKKGDVIIVPKKLMFQRGIDLVSEVADIFYKLTLTVAAMNTVGVL